MDQLEYIRMRQERYVQRKEEREKRRRKRNLAIVLIILIAVIGTAIFFVGKKVLPLNKDKNTAQVSVSGTNQIEVKEKPVKDTGDVQKEVPPEPESPEVVQPSSAEPSQEPPLVADGNYSAHYCYKAQNQSRYESYHAKKPGLTVDEVVWQVNAYLDMPFYGCSVPAGDISDPLVIVNKFYKVDASQKPTLVSADGYQMTPATKDAYLQMKRDAAANGLKILAASTYRTVSYQEGLYNRYLNDDPKDVVDTYSARPGHSEHHTGMAIDFIGSFGSLNDFKNTPEYPWVRDNCHKYGFIIRYTAENQWITGYKDEPWHLRYIGVNAATDMKNKGISSFEEYRVKYIENTP